jgi:hypothetical protein
VCSPDRGRVDETRFLPTYRNVHVPEFEKAGTYANSCTVWHTEHEFTIDFGVDQAQPEVVEGDTEYLLADTRVVARVRLAPTAVGLVLRHIAVSMSEYESTWGPIHRRSEPHEDPLFPPNEEGE